MDDRELSLFEKKVLEEIQKYTPAAVQENKKEIRMWEEEVKDLQGMSIEAANMDAFKKSGMPVLERQISELETSCQTLALQAEETLRKLNDIKKDIKEISVLRQHAATVTQTQKDIERLNREIASLEADLATTGSTKTADDLQEELDALSSAL